MRGLIPRGVFSRRRFSDEGCRDDLIASWACACRRAVDRSRILPHPHPEASDGVDAYAMLGDSLLNAALIRCLIQHQRIPLDKGFLTYVINTARSNANLSRRAPSALEGIVCGADFELIGSDHRRATCLEAAVAIMAECPVAAAGSSSCGQQQQPVESLARVLLLDVGVDLRADDPFARVAEAMKKTDSPKTLLYDKGGTVSGYRCGGLDHRPVFKAVAKLGSHTATTMVGMPSKKSAEVAAAEMVLVMAAGEVE